MCLFVWEYQFYKVVLHFDGRTWLDCCPSSTALWAVDFALKIVPWNNGKNVRLQLWDIAGQERFSSMTRVYYKQATACVIIFDITRRSTFQVATLARLRGVVPCMIHICIPDLATCLDMRRNAPSSTAAKPVRVAILFLDAHAFGVLVCFFLLSSLT